MLQYREVGWEQAGLLMEGSGGSFLCVLDAGLACYCTSRNHSSSVPASESPRDAWSGCAGHQAANGQPVQARPTTPDPGADQRPEYHFASKYCHYASFCDTVLL